MAFIICKEKSFKYKAKISEPENGRKITREIEFEFLVKSPEDVNALLRESRDSRGTEDEAAFDLRLCEEVVRGWRSGDIKTEDGEPFEFSADNLNVILAIPYVRLAIVETYFDAIKGGAKKGN